MTLRVDRRLLLQGGSALAIAALLPGCATSRGRSPNPALISEVPRSDYGFATTCDDVAAGYDLSGKTILITGCNSGLGYESMRTLASRGAHVIGTARTLEKAEQACSSVEGQTTPLVCELTDMDSVAACAIAADELLNNSNKHLDVLMCNAGIMALPKLEQVDVNGVTLEKQFVVNHLGHYLLTRNLLSQVEAAAGRVMMLSSTGYSLAPAEGIQFDNLSAAVKYKSFSAYGQTKLSNALFADEVARRYANTGLTSNSVHPGIVATNLGRYMSSKPRDPNKPLRKGFKNPAQGAATQVYVAIDSRLAGVTGYYFEDCNPSAMTGPHAENEALALKLWNVSAQLVTPWLSST